MNERGLDIPAGGLQVPDSPGFFVWKREKAEGGDSPSGRQMVHFQPHVLTDPCPCGSGEPFGSCCRAFGPHRLFVASASGGFACAVSYREEWTAVALPSIRTALLDNGNWWCTEDSLTRCFWHFAPRLSGSRELFGTVELSPSGLILEALSKPRYQELRTALEAAVGPLPAGHRQVRALIPEQTEASTVASASEASDALRDREPILEHYATLRTRLRELHTAAIRELLRDEIQRAGKDLGVTGPGQTLVLDSESDTELLMDHALYDVQRHGRPIIHHFMRRTPAEDDVSLLLYKAMAASWVSIFAVEQVTPEGLIVRDRMSGGEDLLRLVDYGLISTAIPGMALVGRLLPTPRCCMLSGWGFAAEAQRIPLLLKQAQLIWATRPPRTRTGALIRAVRAVLSQVSMSHNPL